MAHLLALIVAWLRRLFARGLEIEVMVEDDVATRRSAPKPRARSYTPCGEDLLRSSGSHWQSAHPPPMPAPKTSPLPPMPDWKSIIW